MKPMRNSSRILGLLALCFGFLLCAGCMEDSFIKAKVKSPIVSDSLLGSASVGKVDGGEFVKEGWKPGAAGKLIYDLPGMTQGLIVFEAKGLDRSAKNSTFFSLYEPTDLGDYADPYVLFNPYRVALTLNSYPKPAFDFLWTIKKFPAAAAPIDHYVKGLPEGVEGIETVVTSSDVPLFPDQVYKISIAWSMGEATLRLGGQTVAVVKYAPRLYDAQSLRAVFGRSPGMDELDLKNLVISNIAITFPGMAK
ncbi:MAG: hypothetical protein AB1656_01550 [Candidatus Omnitrophota bacterium]